MIIQSAACRRDRCGRWFLFCSLLATAAWASELSAAEPGAVGTVEGTVVYRAGAAQWRYARYYVRDARQGFLAEAVVALRSRALAGLSPPSTPATHTVDQKNFQFVPETIAIRASDMIRFTNSDRETHNVRTSSRLADFNVNTLPGTPYVHRFERSGGIRQPATLGCVFHGAMRAWIFVFDHPFYTVTGQDGQFRWEGVPAGSYELEVFHPAGALHWSSQIAVVPGETLSVAVSLPSGAAGQVSASR